jgi:NitT/TauT family transport system permease protein
MRPTLRKLAGVVAFLLVWEATSRSGLVDSEYVPPPSVVGGALVHILGQAEFVQDSVSTVLSWLISVILAAVIGIGLGLLLGSAPRLRTAASIVVEFLRPLPGVALIPLVIALIGVQAQTKITVAAFVAIWPIMFNTIYAIGGIDPGLLEVARSYRIPRWRQVLFVKLPATLPFILTGLRFATAIALISLVSTEFLSGGTIGLGEFIYANGSEANRMDLVLAGTAFAGILGFLANALINGAQRWFLPWAPSGGAA